MAGQSRKWMILVATIWIQAFTGTNFDFSAYSSEMKSVLAISQVQLNYLAVASDLGKVFGWSSGLAAMCMPLWVVMFIAASMGMLGYGLQWLVIRNVITLPYFVVFLLCLLAGCSICWFNTVCFVLCNRNFPSNRPLAISLTVSFNGVSAALYNLATTALNPDSSSLYLLLNALLPLLTSAASLIPVLRQPPGSLPPSTNTTKRDSVIFLVLNVLAVITGFYLLFVSSSDKFIARILFTGALVLLVLPLGIPGIVYARDWAHKTINSSFTINGSGFILVDVDDLELHKEIITRESSMANGFTDGEKTPLLSRHNTGTENGCCETIIDKDKLVMLGEEHNAMMLMQRLDFWLYYLAYFCGGTIGLVYSNNLGQIAQSLGQSSKTSTLITLYSSFSFFGRLLSAAPDFMRIKVYFARTGWLAIALIPTPIAFFLIAAYGTTIALHVSTALIGLSSGFIFAAAVSVTSELFGPNRVGVNHNILITNIPIGSLLYGLLAALVYDANANPGHMSMVSDSVVCMGRRCYFTTFIWWGVISLVGLGISLLLFLRTRHAYYRFEKDRRSSQLY